MQIDDKPKSMSVKDYLIRVQAVKMLMSEKTIESVINHQFQSLSEAMRSNNSVELSGFGKFYFNSKKATKRLVNLLSKKEFLEKQLEDETLTEAKRNRSSVTLITTEADITYIKSKLETNEA
jgi:nucleoid DNA-binding protein